MKIGNLDISSFKVGGADCSIYLGTVKLYPTTPTFKWLATYTGGSVTSAECDSSSAITEGEISKTGLTSVEIGDCVTSIGDYAFFDCSSLASVNIGTGVTSIGRSAFWQCTGLTSVTVLATNPPTLGGGVFNNTNNCPIYVPDVSAYQSASGWSSYASRIQAIPT